MNLHLNNDELKMDYHVVMQYIKKNEWERAQKELDENRKLLFFRFNKNEMNLLMIACRHSENRTVKLLIEYIKKNGKLEDFINYRSKEGNTALHFTVLNTNNTVNGKSDIATIVTLVQNKADINAVNKNGDTPLHCAVRYAGEKSSLETVHLLIKYSANINCLNNNYVTPFIIAVRNTFKREYTKELISIKLNVLKLLIDYNADITRPDRNGMTGLMYASKGMKDLLECTYEAFRLVLQTVLTTENWEENLNKKNIRGWTALHFAVNNYGYGEKCVKDLLYYGANPNITNDLGNTPLHVALIENIRDDIINMLIVKMNIKELKIENNLGQTALCLADEKLRIKIKEDLTNLMFGG